MNYSELLQLAKGWSNLVSNRIIIWRLRLKNASGMNERELKIAREIQEGIIKYLSDEEGE